MTKNKNKKIKKRFEEKVQKFLLKNKQTKKHQTKHRLGAFHHTDMLCEYSTSTAIQIRVFDNGAVLGNS